MALTFLPRSPHLKLACAKLHDVPELVSLWYRVFESPDIRAIWPDTPGVRQWWDATIRHDMLGRPQEKYLKVVDTEQRGGGSIVAWMKWFLQTAEARGPRYIPWHQDMDIGRNTAYFKELEKSRDRLVGGGRYNFCRQSQPWNLNKQKRADIETHSRCRHARSRAQISKIGIGSSAHEMGL
jgi:hypothetical protein